MNIFIIIQTSAALIAAARGWGSTPIGILWLVIWGSYRQWWSVDTALILDYASIIILIFMAVIPANYTDNTKE